MTSASPAILVVDDDVDTCSNLADILTDLGYHVDTANDGPTALTLASTRSPDRSRRFISSNWRRPWLFDSRESGRQELGGGPSSCPSLRSSESRLRSSRPGNG